MFSEILAQRPRRKFAQRTLSSLTPGLLDFSAGISLGDLCAKKNDRLIQKRFTSSIRFSPLVVKNIFSFEIMIAIKNIDIIKSGITLFKNFSWDSPSNENWVISGRNGSGKTLLLEALAGILHFPRGEIQYDFIKGEKLQREHRTGRESCIP